MKDIIRHALGVVFLFFFLLFLFLSAIQFEVLTPRFWTNSLKTSGAYQGIIQTIGSSEKSGGLSLKEIVTEERLQQAVEENISRILSYAQGKSKELLLFLPLRDWGFPPVLFTQQPFKSITRDTKLVDAFAAFNMEQDVVQQVISDLGIVQQLVQILPVVWFVLLIIVVGLGVAYYSLGVGKARFNHIGFLFIAAGLVAGFIGTSAGVLGTTLMRGTSGWPVWAKDLGAQLVTQFFSLGQFIGFAVAVAGVVIFVVTNKLVEQEKRKGKETRESMKARIAKLIAGVGLGSAVILLSFFGLITVLGGKFNVNVGTTSGKGAVQTGGKYTSKFGWSIVPPSGWTVVEDPKFVQFNKKGSSVSEPWAYIQVRSTERFSSIDQGTYASIAKDGLLSGKVGLTNVVFVEEPRQDGWQSWKRIVLYFDGDDQKLGRVRTLRWMLYPPANGSGWALLAVGNAKTWNTFESAIMSALNSFKVQ